MDTKPSAPKLQEPSKPSLPHNNLDWQAAAILLACCVFWGFQQVLTKATIPEIAPVFQTALRYILATGFLLAWCAWRGVALLERDGSLRAGLVAGVLFCLEFVFISLALNYTSASRSTLFVYTSPFVVALVLPLFVPTERLRAWQWLGLMLAFAAIPLALGLFTQAETSTHSLKGDLLALAGGCAWGFTTVAIRTLGLTKIPAAKLLLYQIGLCALVLPLLSLAVGEVWNWRWSPFAWGSLLLQSFVGAFVSFFAWMWLLGRYPATKVSTFVFLTPVFALIFDALWLREPITVNMVGALCLIAAGLVLLNRKK